MSTTEVTIDDIGAVEHVVIPFPEEGGIVVLRGDNGVGKSTCIGAVSELTSGRKSGTVSKRDDAIKGSIDGFGAKITIAKKPGRSGECAVRSLEGKFDLAALVDPKLKTPEAADDARIKALIGIAGGDDYGGEVFDDLLGTREALLKYVPSSLLEGHDIVAMAAKIKRELDAAALKEERLSESDAAVAKAKEDGIRGIPMDVETDEAVLRRETDAAVRHQAGLEEKQRAADEAETRAEAARVCIERSEPTNLDEVERQEQVAREAENITRQDVEALKVKLAEAERQYLAARSAHQVAFERLESAKKQERLLAQWRASVEEATRTVAPTEEELLAAERAVQDGNAALIAGARAREAAEMKEEAEQYRIQEIQHNFNAAKLRDAGQATDDKLSQIVGKLDTPLRVSHGRLVLETKRGPQTPFADLSPGERWPIAIDIAVKAVGRGGIIHLPQECWEGLSPRNRKLINEQISGSGVMVLTAQCSDDPAVRAEVFSG